MASNSVCSDFAALHQSSLHAWCVFREHLARVRLPPNVDFLRAPVCVGTYSRAFREWHSDCNNQARLTCDNKRVSASLASAREPRRAADDQGFYQCGSFGKTSNSASGTGKKSTRWAAYFATASITSRNGSIAWRTRCATATCIPDRKHSLVVRPRCGNQERAGEPAECRSNPYLAVLHGKLFTGKNVHQIS